MDTSRALAKLSESADLVRMLEELMDPTRGVKLTPATLSGFRLTLKNIREAILESHDSLTAPSANPHTNQNLDAAQGATDPKSAGRVMLESVLSSQAQETRTSVQALRESTAETATGPLQTEAVPAEEELARGAFLRKNTLRTSIERIVGR
jgi:hypothetical protein